MPDSLLPTPSTPVTVDRPDGGGVVSLDTPTMYANLYAQNARADGNCDGIELGARAYRTPESAERRARSHSIRVGLTYAGPVLVSVGISRESLVGRIQHEYATQANLAAAREADRLRCEAARAADEGSDGVDDTESDADE